MVLVQFDIVSFWSKRTSKALFYGLNTNFFFEHGLEDRSSDSCSEKVTGTIDWKIYQVEGSKGVSFFTEIAWKWAQNRLYMLVVGERNACILYPCQQRDRNSVMRPNRTITTCGRERKVPLKGCYDCTDGSLKFNDLSTACPYYSIVCQLSMSSLSTAFTFSLSVNCISFRLDRVSTVCIISLSTTCLL